MLSPSLPWLICWAAWPIPPKLVVGAQRLLRVAGAHRKELERLEEHSPALVDVHGPDLSGPDVHILEKVMMDLLQLLHGAIDLEVRILGKFIAPRMLRSDSASSRIRASVMPSLFRNTRAPGMRYGSSPPSMINLPRILP